MLRVLIVAMALFCAPLPVVAAEATAADLIRQIGFDTLFRDFGTTLATSPRQHGVADERFLVAWETSASNAFGSGELNRRLQQSLAARLTQAEMQQIGDFLASPLGLRLAGLERATRRIAPDRQIETLAKGKTLYLVLPDTRRARFEEVMQLSSSDMAFAMLNQSLRGMAMGLRLSGSGDIDVSWDEVDREVQARLTGLHESLVDATRATLAFTYAELSAPELEAYLDFLRRPATRRFYATATAAIGQIIGETMLGISRDVAARMSAVSI